MSYTQFHLNEQNKDIFVCNQTNKIYNADGSLVASPYHFINNINKQHVVDSWGKTTKSNVPVRLRIILGQACNYSCSYCIQKDLGDPSERNKNENIFRFITTFEEKMDKSELRRVELWGGEPFLYWDDMVTLMRYFDGDGI